jgi:Tol biopolymer transport system component
MPTRRYEAHDTGSREFSPAGGFPRAIAAVIAVAALAAVAFGVYWFLGQPREAKPERAAGPINIQRLTGDGRSRNPTISPDGKFLVFTKLDEGKESLWIKQIQTESSVNVVKPGEASGIFGTAFSPEGNFVYFNAEMEGQERPTVYRVPTLGGTPVKFIEDALLVRFSGDGKQISFRRVDPAANKESIYVADADGSNPRERASRSGKQFFASAAAWSPDGKLLAAAVGDDDRGPKGASIVLYDVAGGSEREFVPRRWEQIDDLVWHPSGDSLILLGTENALVEGRVFEVAYPSGEVRQLTNDLNGHYSISITADGNSIVTGERYARSAVWVSPDLKPENAKQVMPSTGDTWGVSWTPDGRIVYVSDQTGYTEVWMMNADGTDARAVTNDRTFKLCPYASPDGRHIVYTSSKNGGQIERINIDGSGVTVLTKTVAADNAHISPDGRWVIYSAIVDGVSRVLRVPLEGGDEQPLVDYPAREPRYSNDGKWFACFLLVEKRLQWNRLAIVPAEGGAPVKTFDVPGQVNETRGPVWTPDDKGINVVIAPGEKQNLWLQPVDGGPGRAMTDLPSPGIARRDYSRDGKRIAIVRAEGISNAIMISNFR